MEQNMINTLLGYAQRMKELEKQLNLMMILAVFVNMLIAGVGIKVGLFFSVILFLIHMVTFMSCSTSIVKEKVEIFSELEKIAEKEIEGQIDVKEKIRLLIQKVSEYMGSEK